MSQTEFDLSSSTASQRYQPLAERMRPHTLDEVVGQGHLVGPGTGLREALDAGRIHSMIL